MPAYRTPGMPGTSSRSRANTGYRADAAMNCKWGREDAEEDYYLVSRRIVEIGQAMGWVTSLKTD